MFCPNCGTEISDSAVICTSCGANVAESNNQSGKGIESFLEGKDKKTLIAAVAAAAAVVLIVVVVIAVTLLGNNYKTPVKKMVKLLNKKAESSLDYNELLCAPYEASYRKTHAQIMEKYDDYTDDYGKVKDAYEYVIDDFEDEYGDDYKITIKKIKNVDKMDKDDLEDIQDDIREPYEDKDDIEDAVDDMEDSLEYYEDEYDISAKDSKKIVKAYEKYLKAQAKAKVSKGYEMTVEFKVKGEDGHAEYKAKNIQVIKINGKWVLNDLSPSSLYYGFE